MDPLATYWIKLGCQEVLLWCHWSYPSGVVFELEENYIEEAANFLDKIHEPGVKAAQLLCDHESDSNVVDHQ